MAGTGVPALPTSMQQLGGPGGRQIFALMLAGATAVSLAAGAWMWAQTPDYRVLFGNVSDRDGGAIIAQLTQMNVPYRFAEGGGAILVPADRVHEARLRLASQGLPKGSAVGFESMDSPRLGTSQFLEQVNFQRALEGELARSIQSVAAVANARVHLAIPKPSVFLREQQKPSASVLVNLHPGRSLEPGQVSAIVHLVSSSVPELAVKNVTVVDQNGTLLSAQGGDIRQTGLDPGQLKYIKEIEQGFVQRVESILSPIVGAANVRAQVTADIDFSVTEQAEETYRPNQGDQPAAVRSLNSSEAGSNGPGSSAGGIPGALSNQPPAPASAPISAAESAPSGGAAAAAAAPASSRKDSTINYEVDKSLRHIRHSTGTVKRLSVAVVVNHRKLSGKDGKTTLKARSAAEMAQIDKLVRESMGYNEARGDTVTVANTPFNVEEVETLPDDPWWKQPHTWLLAKDIGKHLLIAAVALFLFLRVLRPMFRTAMTPPPAPRALSGAEMDEDSGQTARSAMRSERHLESAKQLARQEPKLVANIVRNWVSGNEG